MRISRTLLLGLGIWLAFPVSTVAYWDWNFLVGASAGAAYRTGQVRTNMDYRGTAAVIPADNAFIHLSQKLSDDGFIWGLLGGVQATCGPYAFGIEANYQKHDFDENMSFAFSDSANIQSWNGQARYEQGDLFTLSLRAGYKVLDWLMVYARLGVANSKDKLTMTYNGSDGYPFSFSSQDTRRNIRPFGGIGLEVPFPFLSSIVARLEYNYYRKGKFLGKGELFTDSAAFALNPYFLSETKQKSHVALASIVWNFG